MDFFGMHRLHRLQVILSHQCAKGPDHLGVHVLEFRGFKQPGMPPLALNSYGLV